MPVNTIVNTCRSISDSALFSLILFGLLGSLQQRHTSGEQPGRFLFILEIKIPS